MLRVILHELIYTAIRYSVLLPVSKRERAQRPRSLSQAFATKFRCVWHLKKAQAAPVKVSGDVLADSEPSLEQDQLELLSLTTCLT
jgi:hypothetical protein